MRAILEYIVVGVQVGCVGVGRVDRDCFVSLGRDTEDGCERDGNYSSDENSGGEPFEWILSLERIRK